MSASKSRRHLGGLALLAGLIACDNSTIESEPPLGELQLVAPAPGDTLRGETRVQIVSPDFERLVLVGLAVDGEEVAINTLSPFDNWLDVHTWADGETHTLQVWAISEGAQRAESEPVPVVIQAGAARPANYTAFNRTHGSPADDWIEELMPSGNGWLAAGSAGGRAWLVRLDRQGDRVWHWQYGTVNGQLNAVEEGRSGGLRVAGMRDGLAWFGRLDANGALVSGTEYGQFGAGEITDLLPWSDGDWLALANTQAGGLLLRLDDTGAVVWSREPAPGNTVSLERLVLAPTGDLWICGAWNPGGEREAALVITDHSGVTRHLRNLGSGHAWDLQLDGEGVVVCGESGASAEVAQATLWRLDGVGELLESRGVANNAPHSAHRLLPGTSDHWIVAGWSAGALSDGLDGLLAEVSFAQGTVWQRAHGLGQGEEFRALVPATDGGLVVAGMTNSQGQGGLDGWFLHTSIQGVHP
jgi:hypothetical protein